MSALSWINPFLSNGVLPMEYSNRLFAILDECRTGKFLSDFDVDTNRGDLERWEDINSYIDANEIELTDEQTEAHSLISTYVFKNTFAGSQAELYEEMLETCISHPMVCPSVISGISEMAGYLPEKYHKKLPTRGGWIMIKRDIMVEEKLRPVVYGVYFAKGYWVECPRAKTVVKDYKIRLANAGKRYMVKINTGLSDISVYPHEYVVVDDIKIIFATLGKDYEMVKLGGTPNVEEERTHYLLSRGISRDKVYEKLLATVNTSNYCFFKPSEQTANALYRMHNGMSSVIADFEPPKLAIKF